MKWLRNLIEGLKIDKDTYFGWSAVFRNYGMRDLWNDSIVPTLGSVIIVGISLFSTTDSSLKLNTAFDIGLSIVPIIISLLIAGYAILLTVFCSSIANDIKNEEGGVELLNDLNSSFAVSILVSLITTVFLLCGRFFYFLEIPCESALYINTLVLVLALYLILFSILILKDIVIAIFNLGQVFINFK